MHETLADAVLCIDKLLKRKGWQELQHDPLADSGPARAQLWKAALLGRPLDESEARLNKAQLRRIHQDANRRDKPQAAVQNCQVARGRGAAGLLGDVARPTGVRSPIEDHPPHAADQQDQHAEHRLDHHQGKPLEAGVKFGVVHFASARVGGDVWGVRATSAGVVGGMVEPSDRVEQRRHQYDQTH